MSMIPQGLFDANGFSKNWIFPTNQLKIDHYLEVTNSVKFTHLGKCLQPWLMVSRSLNPSAICTFIAEQTKHVDLIAKQGTWSRAQHDQWVCFNLSELEAWLWSSAVNTFILPESERLAECIPQNEKMFKKGALVIDEYLSDHTYFIENRFTVTDIIIGYTLNWARRKRLTEDFLSISAYLERLFAREHCVLPQDWPAEGI